MHRRNYLQASLAVAGRLLLPTGALASLSACSGIANEDAPTEIDGAIMGTYYRVLAYGQSTPATADGIHAVLNDIDTRMSTWRPDSELSLFNASLTTDWHPLSSPTVEVIAHAQRTSEQTAGAFDASVGPLVDIWGFGAGTNQAIGDRPGADTVEAARARIGYRSLDVDRRAHRVRKKRPDLQLDLSGIAKGYAVDRVCQWLDDKGFAAYLVDIGGELRARGRKPDSRTWTVGIERPIRGPREPQMLVALNNQAIATSGNYRQFYEWDDRRYSHTMDPRTGEPVEHELLSATVLADTTMQADAWSTSLMVLGPEAGLAFAEEYSIAAIFMTQEGKQLRVQQSSAARQALSV